MLHDRHPVDNLIEETIRLFPKMDPRVERTGKILRQAGQSVQESFQNFTPTDPARRWTRLGDNRRLAQVMNHWERGQAYKTNPSVASKDSC
jgi:hypothetical protein